MIDRIKLLIERGSLFEALTLIQQELNNRFDLTEGNQRQNYNQLRELQERLQSEIGEAVCSEINTEETMRSFTAQQTRPKLTYKDLINRISVNEALSQITIKKHIDALSDDYEAYIIVLDKRNIPEETFSKFNYPPKERLMHLQTGDHFNTQTVTGQNCFSIIGYSGENDSDVISVARGLNEIINAIYEEKLERVGVLFTFDEDERSNDFQKAYFHLILITFLMNVIQNSEENTQPNFYFSFEQEPARNLFEKTALYLRKTDTVAPNIIAKKRDDRLRLLVENSLTKNQEYIEQLKSVINIIDEEDVPILIIGESGVGKSFLANQIHNSSIRREEPFEEQNCGGLEEDKLNQKLWGWKKGSFTDARKDHDGKVKRAEGGTLFLDEIDRTTVGVRNALLTFIEKKKYEVLGADETEVADVRLVFGSNKNMKDLVKKGLFEQDFYYRISERVIEIPPLRERIEDIDLIITTTLNMLSEKKGSIISIDKKEREFLKKYSWPGNVRELMRYIKNVYLDAFSEGYTEITLEQLQATPFDDISVTREEDYEVLVENLKKFLSDWDDTKGPFLDEIIAPILAKLYMDDCFKSVNRTKKWEQAMDMLGISGTKYNSSTLGKSYDKFVEVKSKLGF